MKQTKHTDKADSRSPILLSIRTEKDALRYLRQTNPDMFADRDFRDLAAMILLELGNSIQGISPLKLVSIISTVQTLMYKMGTAAIQSIHGGPKMARRCVDNYKKNREGAKNECTANT
jgi:hypothetical protein